MYLERMTVANGMSVNMIAGVRDENGNHLVYLNMMGNPQAVHSTWATLKSGGSKPYIRPLGGSVHLRKQQHSVYSKTLPCGWTNHIMLHKQASVLNVDTQDDCFYMIQLDDQIAQDDWKAMPTNFHPMLSKVMPFPILEEWKDHLWETAWYENLVTRLYDSKNCAGYRVTNKPDKWARLIKEGFEKKLLDLDGLYDIERHPQDKLDDLFDVDPTNAEYISNEWLK